jgi:hypothetical protein
VVAVRLLSQGFPFKEEILELQYRKKATLWSTLLLILTLGKKGNLETPWLVRVEALLYFK